MARTKLAVLTLTISIFLLVAAGTASAATDFNASFSGKSGGCEPTYFRCASGRVAGYGPARWNYRFEIVEFTSRSCAKIASQTRIRLTSDGSRLDLEGEGEICFPGNSTNAPGSFVSNGNPFRTTETWTVADATGRFAGKTGSGTSTVHSAGNHASAEYHGTLIP